MVVEDLLFFSNETKNICQQHNVVHDIIILPIPDDKLLYDNTIIEPNSLCVLKEGDVEYSNCVFLKADEKEFNVFVDFGLLIVDLRADE